MRNQNYLTVTKLNALLVNFLSNDNDDKFYLDCFWNFQSHEMLKEHGELCNNHECQEEIKMPKNFKSVVHKDT